MSEGGSVEQCGWLKDRGTRALGELMKDRDPTRARRVAEAMLRMDKIDIADLKQAYDGDSAA